MWAGRRFTGSSNDCTCNLNGSIPLPPNDGQPLGKNSERWTKDVIKCKNCSHYSHSLAGRTKRTNNLRAFFIAIFTVFMVAVNISPWIPYTGTPSISYVGFGTISINGNSGFTNASGVVWGSGTSSDPYIISGWEIAGGGIVLIWIQNTNANLIVKDCYLHSGRGGIYLIGCQNITIDDLIVESNADAGIVVSNGNNCRVLNSNSSQNGHEGITSTSSSNCTIANSTIYRNGYEGVYIDGSRNITVSNNTIRENVFVAPRYLYEYHTGIVLLSSQDVSVYHNKLINNAYQQAYDNRGSENSWDAGYPTGGNYWSNYTGIDLYHGSLQNQPGSDGIGDSPHVLDSNTSDRFPLTLNSPPAADFFVLPSAGSMMRNPGGNSVDENFDRYTTINDPAFILNWTEMPPGGSGSESASIDSLPGSGKAFNGTAVNSPGTGISQIYDNSKMTASNFILEFAIENMTYSGGSVVGQFDVGVDFRATQTSCYRFVFSYAASNGICARIERFDSGRQFPVAFQLLNSTAWRTPSFPENHLVRIECADHSIAIFIDESSTPNLTASDSTYSAGFVGTYIQSGDGGGGAITVYRNIDNISLISNMSTAFSFNASISSDHEDGTAPLQVRWDWEDDGIWDTSWSTEKIAQHRFSKRGEFTVCVEIKDLNGSISYARKRVVILQSSGIFAIGGRDMGTYPATNEHLCSDSDSWFWSPSVDLPLPRAGIAAASIGERVYLFGGIFENGTRTAEVDIYDASNNTWRKGTPMSSSRSFAAAVTLGDSIYVIGGDDAFGTVLGTVGIYHPLTDNWTNAQDMPTPRNRLAAAVSNGVIYAIGGYNAGSLDTVEAYNFTTKAWSTKQPMLEVRNSLGAAALDGILYVAGGHQNPGTYLSIVAAYNISTDSWVAITPMTIARSELGVVAYDGLIWAIGGQAGSSATTNATEIYNPILDSWSTAPSMTTSRSGLGVAVLNPFPYANFTSFQVLGNGTTTFQFNASLSSDSNEMSQNLSYRWDFESDGFWDTPWYSNTTILHRFSSVGNHSITLEIKTADERFSYQIDHITIIDEPPEASFTISATLGNLSTEFQVNASSSHDLEDPSSTLQVSWDWENNGTWTIWTTDKNCSHIYSVPGNHTIRLRVLDTFGLIGYALQNITIDATPPTTDIQINGILGKNGWFISYPFINLTAGDLDCGVCWIEYEVDGAGWITYISNLSISNGIHSISFRSVDNVGNVESIKSTMIRVDNNTFPITTSSVLGAKGSNGWYISNASINLSSLDVISGVNHTIYQLDGGSWFDYISNLTISDGHHIISFFSEDMAGHIETIHSINVSVDNDSPPVTSASLSGILGNNGWYIGDVNLNISSSDAISGVNATKYRVDGGNWIDYTDLLLISEGNHTIDMYSIDVAGNTENIRSCTILLDHTAPLLAIDLADGASFNQNSIRINFTCLDALSGIARIEYSIDGSSFTNLSPSEQINLTGLENGNHVLIVRGWDFAGNEVNRALAFRVEVPTQDYSLSLLIIGMIITMACIIAIRVKFDDIVQWQEARTRRNEFLAEKERELSDLMRQFSEENK